MGVSVNEGGEIDEDEHYKECMRLANLAAEAVGGGGTGSKTPCATPASCSSSGQRNGALRAFAGEDNGAPSSSTARGRGSKDMSMRSESKEHCDTPPRGFPMPAFDKPAGAGSMTM